MSEPLKMLKKIAAKWEHDLKYYDDLPDTPKLREHKRLAHRAMVGSKIIVLRDHSPFLPRSWLMEFSS